VSVRLGLKAFPTLLRIGLLEAFAYRAEFVIWMLVTTMPLVMLGLMTAVTSDGAFTAPSGRSFDQGAVNSYYLATLIVRQLTGSWVVWEMVREIREGSLMLRLLRPVHPLLTYGAEGLAAIPMRALVAAPVAFVALMVTGGDRLARGPSQLGLFALSLLGAWLLNFAVSATIGSLALFVESSASIYELWFGCFMLFSGYLLPLEMFPHWLERICRSLPFAYLQALPVEILTGMRDHHASLVGVGQQWLFAGGAFCLLALVWSRGVRRFSAYGG